MWALRFPHVKPNHKCFAPCSSALTQVEDDQVSITPCETWLQRVAARPSPKSAGLERNDHILAIDLVGPTLAHLKIKCAIPPRFFTDLLSCLKVDGRWQVAQKDFMTEMRRTRGEGDCARRLITTSSGS